MNSIIPIYILQEWKVENGKSNNVGQIQIFFYNLRRTNKHKDSFCKSLTFNSNIQNVMAIREQLLPIITSYKIDEVWVYYEGDLKNILQEIEEIIEGGVLEIKGFFIKVEAASYQKILQHISCHQVAYLNQSDSIFLEAPHLLAYKRMKQQLRKYKVSVEVKYYKTQAALAFLLNKKAIKHSNIELLIRMLCVIGVILYFMEKISKTTYIKWCTYYTGVILGALPFLILGIALSTVIQVFVSKEWIRKVFPKDLKKGIIFGIIGGLFIPVCDCVSIPVFKSLIKKEVPLPAALTFMTVSPIINPIAIMSTYYAYPGHINMVLIRALLGIISGVGISLCLSNEKASEILKENVKKHHHHHHHEDEEEVYQSKKQKFFKKLKVFILTFREEFFEVIHYLLIGIGIATCFQIYLKDYAEQLNELGPISSLIIMMSLAFCLSLCSSSDAIVGKGIGWGFSNMAVMGFLVLGPMLDIKNELLLLSHLNRRFVIKLSLTIVGVCFSVVYIAYCLGLEAIL